MLFDWGEGYDSSLHIVIAWFISAMLVILAMWASGRAFRVPFADCERQQFSWMGLNAMV